MKKMFWIIVAILEWTAAWAMVLLIANVGDDK
jgi:hypothetical protein